MHFRILQNKSHIVSHCSIESIFNHILSPLIGANLPADNILHFTPLGPISVISIIHKFKLFDLPLTFIDTRIIEIDPFISNLNLFSSKTLFSELLRDSFPFFGCIFGIEFQ